jgi:hypothetical protein
LPDGDWVDRAPVHDGATPSWYDGVRLRILQLAHSKCSYAVGATRRSLDPAVSWPEISGHPFISRHSKPDGLPPPPRSSATILTHHGESQANREVAI